MKHSEWWNGYAVKKRQVFLSVPLMDKNVEPEVVADMMNRMKKDLTDIYGDKVELDFHYLDCDIEHCDFAYFPADYEKYEECKKHFELCAQHNVTAVIDV